MQNEEHNNSLTLSTADGVFFDYLDGTLDVEFIAAKAGDVFFKFRVEGDTIVKTPSLTEPFELGQPVFEVAEDCELKAYTSASVSSFFYHMVHWLEAVVCDVYQCSFCWDGEGPDGELSWLRRGDNGTLTMSWSGSTRQDKNSEWFAPPFNRKVRLNKQSMVRSFYESFRNFVESDKYERDQYEGEHFGEELLPLRSSLVEDWLADRRTPSEGAT